MEVLKFILVSWSIGFWINFSLDYLVLHEPFGRTLFYSIIWGFAVVGIGMTFNQLYFYFIGKL